MSSITPIQEEDLRVGDDLVFLGTPHRITRIEPYNGPHKNIGCFAIAHDAFGWGISLWRGQMIDIVSRRMYL